MISSKYEYRILPEGERSQIIFKRLGTKEWLQLSSYPTYEMASQRVETMIEDDDWKPELVGKWGKYEN